MHRKNVLLINLPGLETSAPPISLATLKGAIEPAHQIKTFDLNFYINKIVGLDSNFLTIHQHGIDKKIEEAASTFFTKHPIGKETYDVIGISILSLWQENIAKIIINVIKTYKHAKIIAGGPFFVYSDKKHFNREFWLDNLDAFIVGDAEISLKHYLDGNTTYSGINSSIYDIKFDRDKISFPNYDDFDVHIYEEMQVVQSKGCVRRCSFCTVPAVWPKYVYKSSSRMADEILYQYNKYYINQKLPQKFHFIDSLINGSKKLLDQTTLSLLYHFGKNSEKMYWGGQAICTNQNHIPLQLYKQAAEAGLKYLITGVESGSETVRWNMNKKFKNIDLINFLMICYKLKINFVPLMIIGFPTETENDFQETLNLLTLFKKFGVNHIVPRSTALMSLGPNMDVTINAKKYGISNIKNSWNWNSQFHDFDERINRVHRYASRAAELGLTKMSPDDFLAACVPDIDSVRSITSELKAIQ